MIHPVEPKFVPKSNDNNPQINQMINDQLNDAISLNEHVNKTEVIKNEANKNETNKNTANRNVINGESCSDKAISKAGSTNNLSNLKEINKDAILTDTDSSCSIVMEPTLDIKACKERVERIFQKIDKVRFCL